jgi:hypothetical protein
MRELNGNAYTPNNELISLYDLMDALRERQGQRSEAD